MPQFRFVAKGADGKLVDGVITCNDRAAAIRQVEKERGFPIKIEAISTAAEQKAGAQAESSPVADRARRAPAGLSLSHSQLHLFTEQLAHLLTSGMTLDEALGVLVKRMKHPKLSTLAKGLHQALVDGRSLSQALREFPKVFSPLYVNLVAAGEVSGALGEILRRLVAHLADLKKLRDRVQQAMIYPMILVFAGAGLIVVFMRIVVPQLLGFFSKNHQQVPAATQMLLNINNFITNFWWLGVLAVIGGIMAFKIFTRSEEGRHAWDAFLWKLPVISGLTRYRYYSQFARTLGTLMDNGVTLLRALELLEESAGNEYVRRKMHDVRKGVVDGSTLSNVLTAQKIFPEMYTDMMSVGEQAGRFGATMHNIADIYERELDKQVQLVTTLIPPVILFAIAGFIGLIVYSILSAVFSMTSSLGH